MEFPSTCRKLLQSFSKASPGASQNLLRVSPGAFTRSPLEILQRVLMAVPKCQPPHLQNLNGTICTIAGTSMEPHIGLPLSLHAPPHVGITMSILMRFYMGVSMGVSRGTPHNIQKAVLKLPQSFPMKSSCNSPMGIPEEI